MSTLGRFPRHTYLGLELCKIGPVDFIDLDTSYGSVFSTVLNTFDIDMSKQPMKVVHRIRDLIEVVDHVSNRLLRLNQVF